ncbi:MAG: hypothetical protein ABIJ47_11585 [Candidatus Bathyarchaeota archaeon]
MRTPDPWLIENRGHLSWMALTAGGMGVLMLLLANTYPRAIILQVPGALLAVVAVFGWIIVVNKTTPRVTDYLAYLKLEAKKEGLGEWLAGADAEFMETWSLKRLEEIGHE